MRPNFAHYSWATCRSRPFPWSANSHRRRPRQSPRPPSLRLRHPYHQVRPQRRHPRRFLPRPPRRRPSQQISAPPQRQTPGQQPMSCSTSAILSLCRETRDDTTSTRELPPSVDLRYACLTLNRPGIGNYRRSSAQNRAWDRNGCSFVLNIYDMQTCFMDRPKRRRSRCGSIAGPPQPQRRLPGQGHQPTGHPVGRGRRGPMRFPNDKRLILASERRRP
jgi:hypothetical protein